MTRFEDAIVSYAKYHRDPRNIGFHSVGIPTIVFSVYVLLSRSGWSVGDRRLTPAAVLALLSNVYYLSLDVESGTTMIAANAAMLGIADTVAKKNQRTWLSTALGAFGAGWVLQFVGHAYEGRKPAFIDDLKSLIVGPLFVLVEVFYVFGRKKRLLEAVEREAGPVARRGARSFEAA